MKKFHLKRRGLIKIREELSDLKARYTLNYKDELKPFSKAWWYFVGQGALEYDTMDGCGDWYERYLYCKRRLDKK